MAEDWDIKPRSHECQMCHAAFQDGQFCFSVLTFGSEGYARCDYCTVCWKSEGPPPIRVSSWCGIYRRPPPPLEVLRKETAESLLRRLIEEKNETRRAVIYVLAVMLERKRLLVEKDTQRTPAGLLLRVYEHRQTGETFVIVDPELRLDQLEPVQREVAELLGSGSSPGAATTAHSLPPTENGNVLNNTAP